MQAAQSPMINAQPVLERMIDGLFPQAERCRDEVFNLVEELRQSLHVEGLVLQSNAHIHPCWVKIEFWIPLDGRLLTERAWATVKIEPQPFHRFNLLYSVEWDNRGKKKSFPGLTRFTLSEATQLTHYLISGNGEPDFSGLQAAQNAWQIWKPRNEIDAVSRDWIGYFPRAASVMGFLLMVPSRPLGLFFLFAAYIIGRVVKSRPVVVRSNGKPLFEPRTLHRVDSWQTVISGAGVDAELVRRRFLAAIEKPPSPHFRSTVERIWYWGLDGKEEREQILLAFGRAIFFAQIYQYGHELYAGWNAHLNSGTWVEKTIATGIDHSTGRLTHINTVEPGTQQLTEYDVSDVSCLTEWAHAQLVGIVKAYVAERRIDQEIDFKIVRGERQGIVAGSAEPPAPAVTGFVKRLRSAAKV